MFKTAWCRLFIAVGILFSLSSQATVTVRPVSPAAIANGAIHLAGSSSPATLSGGAVDTADGFHAAYAFDKSVLNESQIGALLDTNAYENLIYFDVSSDKAFGTITSGQDLMIHVAAGSATTTPIPIFWANGRRCVQGDTNCYHRTVATATTTATADYFLSAQYVQSSTIRIGLYLRDICKYSTSVTGCGGDEYPDDPSSTAVVSFSLTFYVRATDTASLSNPTSSDENANVSVVLHNEPPTLACNSHSSTVEYFPGDGEIYVNPSVFSQGGTTSAVAPLSKLIVAGDTSTGSCATASGFSACPIRSRLALTGEQKVGGFTNSTSGNTVNHTIGFTYRDAAGIVGDFDLVTCGRSNVQTAEVLGFLKANNCFIATGAFRALDNPALSLLRAFRDRVLLKTWPGRKFTEWYYDWSPQAGVWLVEHPEFRFPVLRALVPLQAAAWLFLHPFFAFGMLFSGLGVWFWRRA